MPVKVRFAVNKSTGEITLFEVTQDQTAGRSTHDDMHDTVARAVGHVLARHLQVSEIRGRPAETVPTPVPQPEPVPVIHQPEAATE